MAKIQKMLKRFIGDESGAALAEYGILIALIAIVAIVAVVYFGGKVSATYSDYANHLT